MPDVVEQFRDALTGRGIVPGQILADGKLHRADAEGRGGKGDAAYLLHLDGVPAGGFQNWRDGLGWQDWRADVGRELTSGEDAAHRRHLKSARSMQKREDARRRAEAAAKAEAIWFEASPGTDHPYRCQKGVKSYGLRLSRGKLVIPVRDVEGRLQSLQFIDRTGSKKFLTGGKVQGGFFIIGELANVILIGEGYATCASGHGASGHAAVVAFDCGNLKATAMGIRAKFPSARLVLLADDDYLTAGNPGLTKAREAAAAVNGIVAVPDFGAYRPAAATDFNDLAHHAGPNAVRRCIEAALATNGREGDRPEVNAEIARLAALPPLDYEREREPGAEKLGCRVTTLDRLVADARRERAPVADAGRGRRLEIADIQPWPEPVDGAALLDELAQTIRRHVVLDAAAADAEALWIVHTHAIDSAYVTPRLAITSPEKRCGKTTNLILLGALVARPLSTANMTTATMFRAIEAVRPTLMVDEADTFLGAAEEMRGIINAGHCRTSATVLRTVDTADGFEVRGFSVWAAMALAAIGRLSGTIEDRSIKVAMRRRRPDETVERLRIDGLDRMRPLAQRAARWAADRAVALRAADPAIPGELHDRAADNWRPLFAIADAAGGDWPQRARRAAINLMHHSADDAETLGTMLLADLREIFGREASGVLFSAEILAALTKREDRPWPENRGGRPITARQLAALLRPFGVAPKTVRRGRDTEKGYRATDLADAWLRYLMPSASNLSVTPLHPTESVEFSAAKSDTPRADVTDPKLPKAPESATCDGVTDAAPLGWRERV